MIPRVKESLDRLRDDIETISRQNSSFEATIERVAEFLDSLERKGDELRSRSAYAKQDPASRSRLRDKASTYEAEARTLRAILENK